MIARLPSPHQSEGFSAWPKLLDAFAAAAALRAKPDAVGRLAAQARRFVWQTGVGPSAIESSHVEVFLAAQRTSGAAAKTILNARSAISVLCNHLVARGLLAANPCRAVIVAKPEQNVPRWLDADQCAAVLAAARQHDAWPAVALAIATGMRLSELRRLAWADLAIERRSALVRKSKAGRPRTVPLNGLALAALAEQAVITGRLAHVFPARKTWRGGWRWVDKPASVNTWGRWLAPVRAACPVFSAGKGVGNGWHLLRHTFASHAAQNGVSLYKLAHWMGHTDVRTTEIYAHLAAGYDPDCELTLPRQEHGRRQ